MNTVMLISVAIGLAMDAFAVAVCKGLKTEKKQLFKSMLVTGFFFGGFQALMPFIGWLLGDRFEKYIVSFDHWIILFLLLFLGGKMLLEALKEDEAACDDVNLDKTDIRELTVLALATSIDALALGITFAFLRVSVLKSCTVIGAVAFLFSFAGVFIGNRFGSGCRKKAGITGGIILIGTGLKIFLEHMGMF